MPTTANMSMVLPTEDASADVWDLLLNAALTLNDAHDHTTGKGVRVPSAGLNINADLAFGSFSITAMRALDFTPAAASTVTSYSSALFANSDDANNLYYRNSSGVNVKITDGSTLNVSIVGGIGGDYSSISALLDYDDASDTYRFRQETSASVRQYAKVSMADLVIREYDPAGDASVPANTITIKSPDALAASYSITLPAAVPATRSVLMMAATGATEFRSGVTQIPASAAHSTSASHTNLNGNAWTLGNSIASVVYPLRVAVGDVITSISLKCSKSSDATNTLQIVLGKSDGLSTFSAQATFTATNAVDAPGTITLTPSPAPTPYTVVAGDQLCIVATQNDSTPSAIDAFGVATVTLA